LGVSSAMIGFYIRHSYTWERLLLFIGGLLLILPEMITNIIGIVILGVVWLIQKQRDDSGTGIQPASAPASS